MHSSGPNTDPHNSSALPPSLSSTNSSSSGFTSCLLAKPNSIVFITFCIVYIFLLLPLCVFILRRGFQQWRRNSSFSSAVKHSDCVTHHVAILELIGVSGCFICVCGVSSNNPKVLTSGFILYSFTCYGETFFHLLMCLEHYLAVVHPITYMALRNQRGVLVRNVGISCAWLLCFTAATLISPVVAVALCLLFLLITIFITCFCCFSVLWVLIHPVPGKQGGVSPGREQLKYKAFYTILAILGAFIARFSCGLLWVSLNVVTGESNCLVVALNCWFNLPSGLVQPLLFLQKAGRQAGLKNSN